MRYLALAMLAVAYLLQLWLIPHLNARAPQVYAVPADPWLDTTVGTPHAAVLAPPRAAAAPQATALGRVEGRLANAQGRGIVGAPLTLHALEEPETPVRTFQSGPEGYFEVKELGVGGYRLIAAHPDAPENTVERGFTLSQGDLHEEMHIVLP